MKKKKKSVDLKVKIIASLLILALLSSIAVGAVRTGIYIHSNQQKNQLEKLDLDKKKYELIAGDIVDINQIPIVRNTEKGNTSSPPVEYTYLIGNLGSPLGDTGVYFNNQKTLYEKQSWNSDKGKTIVLTIDDRLQRECFELTKGTNASICVLERKSGKIKALITTDEKYDLDLASPISEEMQSYINNKSGFYIPNYSKAYYPGSVFKIMTAALLCESGESKYTIDDKGYLIFDEGEVRNYDDISYGLCGLDTAFVHSSNTFFAAAANKIGGQAYQNMFKKMKIGKISTDFGEVNSSLNISDSPSDFELAQLGYGQYSSMDTVSIALVTQALLERRLYMPHAVAGTAKYNGESIEIIDETQEQLLSENIVTKSTSDKITTLMRSAAESYGFKNGILAKTGTGEVVDDNGHNTNRAVIVVADESHIVVISTLKERLFGINLKDHAERILQFLQASEQ